MSTRYDEEPGEPVLEGERADMERIGEREFERSDFDFVVISPADRRGQRRDRERGSDAPPMDVQIEPNLRRLVKTWMLRPLHLGTPHCANGWLSCTSKLVLWLRTSDATRGTETQRGRARGATRAAGRAQPPGARVAVFDFVILL